MKKFKKKNVTGPLKKIIFSGIIFKIIISWTLIFHVITGKTRITDIEIKRTCTDYRTSWLLTNYLLTPISIITNYLPLIECPISIYKPKHFTSVRTTPGHYWCTFDMGRISSAVGILSPKLNETARANEETEGW